MSVGNLSLSTVKHSAVEWLARFWRDPFTLLIVFLAGLGTAHILVRTATYGAVPRTGSIDFLSTALNFLAGEGWRDSGGSPLVLWPPLFPLLLVASGWVGIDPLTAGRWVNATAFGLTILAAGCWLRSQLRSRWLVLTATATLAASLPLSHWAAHLMTELLFVLFTLLALIELATFLNRKTAAPLWWAAVFTALAAITRYPGMVLIGTGVLVLLVRRAVPLTARLKDAVVFGAVSSIPLAGVLTHNWAVSGTPTGPRSGSRKALSNVLSQVAEAFREWVIPPNAPDGVGYLLWIVAGLVVLAAGVVVVWSGRSVGMGGQDEGSGNKGTDRPASPLFGLGPALPFGVFAVSYLVSLVAVTPFVIPHRIGLRLLLPMYVPLLLTAVFLLDRFLSIQGAGWMGAVRYGLASLVVLATLAHIGFSARENLRLTTQAYVAGYGWYGHRTYNIAHWQQSETLNYIEDNHIEGRVYSNKGVLALLGDRTAAMGKLRTYRGIPSKIERVPKIKAGGRTAAMGKSRPYRNILLKIEWDEIEAGAHIVWLDDYYDREDIGYDDLDLRLMPGIEIVAELADGVVFRRTAAEPFDAARHRARKQRYVDHLIQQASEHVVRAGWTVYRTGRTLIYRKEPCAPADVQEVFVLHVVPVDRADLPADRQQYGSENLDFYFNLDSRRQSLGFRLGDQCIAIAHLPSYPIDRIHIGQWIAEENRTLWEAKFPPVQLNHLIQQASERVVRAGWTVYRTGRKLIYRKAPCTPADTQAKFVLHIVPADPADLPPNRKQYGSENLDFYFNQYGERFDDHCMVIAPLPDYAIDRIHIGQWVSADNRTVWEAEFPASR